MKLALFTLLVLATLTATACGILLITYPDGSGMSLPMSVLENTPFKDYFVPGLVLAIVVGGTSMIAVISNIMQHRSRYDWAIAAGLIMCGWIIIQMMMVPLLHWLQFVYLATGLMTLLIAYQLKGRWAV